ncbi:hypothetical protein Taro_025425 [Colocasia esculenta]|uniref:K Homology domain-containing protein n=1 Tax=Colocasia esculenta TaxID=4460 RepID=A0A843VE81_COLES|nr:hypothetical protein [Colocasia esculenta]
MADDIQVSSHKRKYDDEGLSPASDAAIPPARRATGFSAPIAPLSSDSSAAAAAAAPPSYNSVPPPLDGIQLAKQRAQEIAARLLSDAEAKRPRVDNGGPGDDFAGKGFVSSAVDLSHLHKPVGQQVANSLVNMGTSASFATYGYSGTSKKIEIPNSKVGVIIGKGGETIRYLQLQSGAKIQVTRDAEADPYSQTRMVELMGTSEQIDRAEQLINDVLREAEAGGSGTVAARKFVGVQTGSEQLTMKVPNNRVGLLIGKGGETIKNLQANSGARIQIIPLHLPPGDTSIERNVQIDGTKEQVESARQLINEVLSENRVRNPPGGGGYPQQTYRPPPQAPTSWPPPGPPPMQQPGYGYMQPGAYSGPPQQYNVSQPSYPGYPPPPPPASGGYSGGWDQTSSTPGQQTAPSAGYDYYNQQQPQQQPTPVGGSTASDGGAYNYGQSQPSYSTQGSYGENAYSQPHAVPPHGYNQDGYSGGYPAPGPQSGYPHAQSNVQNLYDQQQNYGSATAYGVASQDGSTAAYGALSAAGQAPAQPLPPVQQQGFQTQQPGYGMPPTSQPGSQLPSAGYGQSAPLSQPNYAQPPPAQKASPTQPVCGQAQQPASTQAGYVQPISNPPTYQSLPTHYGQQQSYGGVPPPTQPAYGQQVQQPYSDAYGSGSSGGYSQPTAHSSGGEVGGSIHGSYDAPAAQPLPSGTTKASPQS